MKVQFLEASTTERVEVFPRRKLLNASLQKSCGLAFSFVSLLAVVSFLYCAPCAYNSKEHFGSASECRLPPCLLVVHVVARQSIMRLLEKKVWLAKGLQARRRKFALWLVMMILIAFETAANAGRCYTEKPVRVEIKPYYYDLILTHPLLFHTRLPERILRQHFEDRTHAQWQKVLLQVPCTVCVLDDYCKKRKRKRKEKKKRNGAALCWTDDLQV